MYLLASTFGWTEQQIQETSFGFIKFCINQIEEETKRLNRQIKSNG